MVRFKGLGEHLLLIERENRIFQSITLCTLQDTSGSPGTKIAFVVHAAQPGPARMDYGGAEMAFRIQRRVAIHLSPFGEMMILWIQETEGVT